MQRESSLSKMDRQGALNTNSQQYLQQVHLLNEKATEANPRKSKRQASI